MKKKIFLLVIVLVILLGFSTVVFAGPRFPPLPHTITTTVEATTPDYHFKI